MRVERLQLVITQTLHETYDQRQAQWLMNPSTFIGLVRERAASTS